MRVSQNSFSCQGAGSWSFVVPGQLSWASVDCCPCSCMTASIIPSRPLQSWKLWEMKSWQTGKKGGDIWSYGEPVSNTSPIIFVCQRVKKKEKIVNIRSVKGVNPVPLRQCSGAQVSNLSCSGGYKRAEYPLAAGRTGFTPGSMESHCNGGGFLGWYFFNKSLSILMVCLHDLHTLLKRWRENKIAHFLVVFLLCRRKA